MQITNEVNHRPLLLSSKPELPGDEAPSKKDFFAVMMAIAALIALAWVAYHVFKLHV